MSSDAWTSGASEPEPRDAAAAELHDRCTPAFLSSLTADPGLGAFWHYAPAAAERQLTLLRRVAEVPRGRVLVAVSDGRVIGYLTLHAPEAPSRWADLPGGRVLELGGIEVARGRRMAGLAHRLLLHVFSSPDLEVAIVYAQGLRWCWDLGGTGLGTTEYREMILRLFRVVGFEVQPTDEGNIRQDRANVLLVRVGSGVPPDLEQAFRDRLIQKAEEW